MARARLLLRSIGAVALGLSAMLALPATSTAASYSLNFTGKVDSADPYFLALGIHLGDSVSGSFAVGNLNTDTFTFVPQGFVTLFAETPVSYTFEVTHAAPGGADLRISETGSGLIRSVHGPTNDPNEFNFILGRPSRGFARELSLNYDTNGGAVAGPLFSLAGLPDTSDGILAFLGGAPKTADGRFSVIALSGPDPRPGGLLVFSLTFTPPALPPPAATPIPAALPLLAAALGGLGFVGWRRCNSARGAA
jgi:hypothetical protein